MTSISSQLPGIATQAFYQKLAGGSSSLGVLGGGLGGLGGGISLSGLSDAMNMNPLAGQSALQGLSQFKQQIAMQGALRKAGILPAIEKKGKSATTGTGSAAGGASNMSAIFSMLMALVMAQSNAKSTAADKSKATAAADQEMTSSATPQADATKTTSAMAKSSSTQQKMMLQMMMTMLTMFQSMMGSAAAPQGNAFSLGANPYANPYAMSGLGAGAGMNSLGGMSSGLNALGGLGASSGLGASNSFYTSAGSGGFASIDAAINKTLGSIYATLPMVGL